MTLCRTCHTVIPCHCHLKPPADGAALRDRIAAAVDEGFRLYAELEDTSLGGSIVDSVLAAVLAALPEPADRAAVLREAADVAAQMTSLDTPTTAEWDAGWVAGARAIASELRRMADEAQPTTEAVSRETLLELIRDFLDPDPCSFDHHGYCQAHGWLGGEPGSCPHGRVRKLLPGIDEAPQ